MLQAQLQAVHHATSLSHPHKLCFITNLPVLVLPLPRPHSFSSVQLRQHQQEHSHQAQPQYEGLACRHFHASCCTAVLLSQPQPHLVVVCC